MKISIPSEQLKPILDTYDHVNKFRVKKDSVVLYYSEDKPDFSIPVFHAYQILNSHRPIKKMKVKDGRIYFKFRRSKPKSEVFMKLTFESNNLNFNKCNAVASRFGDVQYINVNKNEMIVRYKSLISYFVAVDKFSKIAEVDFYSSLDSILPNYWI